eukprot:TRINITY_DN835_c0_g2_i1.p1 TRINITY_DN835_c0_g2~~TRINITY_DN835_c0_g2_i1.p1  ORF type:complete len:481 (-),score=91.67 TRINITY_DN835_c0_g2_i1:385-1827(-)
MHGGVDCICELSILPSIRFPFLYPSSFWDPHGDPAEIPLDFGQYNVTVATMKRAAGASLAFPAAFALLFLILYSSVTPIQCSPISSGSGFEWMHLALDPDATVEDPLTWLGGMDGEEHEVRGVESVSTASSRSGAIKHMPAQAASLNPIVIVPGICGSQLNIKLTNKTSEHWFCPSNTEGYELEYIKVGELVPGPIECFLENMQLLWDPTNEQYSNFSGVDMQPVGWGSTDDLAYLDPNLQSLTEYFADTINALLTIGYKDGVNLRGAPYDFRVSPTLYQTDPFFVRFINLIEQTYAMNNNTPVTILSHSMGCLHTSFFFSHYVDATWKAKYIKTWVAVSPPWAGASVALQGVISGYVLGYTIVPKTPFKNLCRTWPSMYYLIPPAAEWGDYPFVTTDTDVFTAQNLSKLFAVMGETDLIGRLESGGNPPGIVQAPGVPLFCLGGGNVSTPLGFNYGANDFDSSPEITYSNGDGTVPFNR